MIRFDLVHQDLVTMRDALRLARADRIRTGEPPLCARARQCLLGWIAILEAFLDEHGERGAEL